MVSKKEKIILDLRPQKLVVKKIISKFDLYISIT